MPKARYITTVTIPHPEFKDGQLLDVLYDPESNSLFALDTAWVDNNTQCLSPYNSGVLDLPTEEDIIAVEKIK